MSRFSLLGTRFDIIVIFFQAERVIDVLFIQYTFFLKLTNVSLLPNFLLFVNMFIELSNRSRVLVVLVFDLFLDVSETSDTGNDEEVVHDVRVISLHRCSIWTDENWVDAVNFFEFIVVIVLIFYNNGVFLNNI